jgi:uncharacterized protein
MIKGLTKEQNDVILHEAVRFERMTRLVVFGSRAIGKQRHGSDVDLAVWGLDADETSKLKIRLNEYTKLPNKFDVIRFESISNPELRQHITDSGKQFFPGT